MRLYFEHDCSCNIFFPASEIDFIRLGRVLKLSLDFFGSELGNFRNQNMRLRLRFKIFNMQLFFSLFVAQDSKLHFKVSNAKPVIASKWR
jgi:hypothetical protein